MRDAIADVMIEERSLHSSGVFMADNEPYPMPDALWPISGIEDDLGQLEWLRIVNETVRWSREISYSQAALALGPATCSPSSSSIRSLRPAGYAT